MLILGRMGNAYPVGLIESGGAPNELASLSERFDQLQMIVDSLPVLIAYIDAQERYRFSNLAHQQWWNVGAEEILGRSMAEVIGAENYRVTEPYIHAALRGEPQRFELTVQYSGRGRRHVGVDYLPHHESDGSVKGICILVHDLTELRLGQQALGKSEDRFRRLVEMTRVIPWEADLATCAFTYVGPQAEQILGYPVHRWLEQDFWPEHIHPDDREMAVRECHLLSLTNDTYELEYRMIRADGAAVWLRDLVSVIQEQGERKKLQGFLIDITAHKQSDQERQELQEQLRQSQKMEALGTLAGGIAHDFNNILTAIRGYSDLALRSLPHQSAAADSLQRVLNSTSRAKELVQRILSFSQRPHGDRRVVNVCQVVGEVIELARGIFPSSIEIRVNDLTRPLHVCANATELQQVFLNLCTNAEFAMRDRPGVLNVQIREIMIDEQDGEEQRFVRISFADSGVGMNQETVRRVFEPYFTTKPVGSGSGLGMSVAHGIVASHGGFVGVESEEGLGTTVEVFLPWVAGIEAKVVDVPNSVSTGRSRILFVDDEVMLAGLGRDLLGSLGHQVTVCTSAREALQTFSANPDEFDLVITDQTMPDLTGDRLVAELRKISPLIPVALCTGYSSRIDQQRAKELGIDAFLMKPYSAAELSEVIGRVSRAISR